MGLGTVLVELILAVHTKVGWALMGLHSVGSDRGTKQIFMLSVPGEWPMH